MSENKNGNKNKESADPNNDDFWVSNNEKQNHKKAIEIYRKGMETKKNEESTSSQDVSLNNEDNEDKTLKTYDVIQWRINKLQDTLLEMVSLFCFDRQGKKFIDDMERRKYDLLCNKAITLQKLLNGVFDYKSLISSYGL